MEVNCSTVAAVAKQQGKHAAVNLFRNTVNAVRELSTFPVQRVTTSSGKVRSRPNGSNPVFKTKNCQPNSGKDNTPLQLLQCYSSKKCFHKPQNKVLNLYLYIYINI